VDACIRCGAKAQEKKLQACPICHKMFCFDCAYPVGGKSFCGKGCGSYFFFGEGEDDQREEV
jgi:hypothetical protein